MKIKLNENQLQLLIEHEFNYHYGNHTDNRPYVSDNKYVMPGRDTGHFGSGTYFSTYKNNDFSFANDNTDPNFIMIGKDTYRVDFDLYKNLYRVSSKKQGDVLYTMLKNLNKLFYRICLMGRFDKNYANYDNSSLYQKIKSNANGLGLNCPSYYELVRMCQKLGSDDNDVRSFSTLFMEYNGFNGVNVSGVDFYDNTTHGSVIYDISKVSNLINKITPKNLYSGYKSYPYDDTIVMNGYDDIMADSLRGEYISWVNDLNNMDINVSMRLLKNYVDSGNVLDLYYIKNLNNLLLKRYLKFLYLKNPYDRYGNRLCDKFVNYDNKRGFIKLIEENELYYWVNYDNEYCSILIELLNRFSLYLDWDLNTDEEKKIKEEYLKKLISHMNRELNEYEIDFIENNFY